MKYLRFPFLLLNVFTVLLLWITAFCSTVSPNTFGWLALSGYAFPFLFIACLVFIALWIFFKKRFCLISIVGLLAVYQPALTYCPLNSSSSAEESSDSLITLLSYNTCDWGNDKAAPVNEMSKDERTKTIIEFLKEKNADILTMQESPLADKAKPLIDFYQYSDTTRGSGDKSVHITLFSKYPILRKESIDLESSAAVGAFWLDVNGREIIVINAHLESMHFTINERENFSTMVHGNQNNRDSIRSTSHTIIGKIYSASKKRARQAEKIAEFIERHRDIPIIIAGDFNDIPNSYVHHTISELLTDCYTSTAFGPGYTFKHFGMRARIDNIMCNNYFTPSDCHIIKDISLSDHQPITCKLKVVDKPVDN
ncbi:MAG: endonuclease/exonuclease/phosphatase family protein [Prevotella sp.]|nr:endonuclease/exonuclease/phosphatase family protein [Prevotella sp.]